MRVTGGVYGLKPYSERNTTVVSVSYEGLSIAPHARVLRDTYLVPVGRSARICLMDIELLRQSASFDNQIVSAEF